MHVVFAALGVNLALNKSVVQSSTYEDMVATLAVDGDVNTVSCTVSLWNNPWWSVNLGAPYYVDHVTVTNDNNQASGNRGRTSCIDSLPTTHCTL